MQKNQENGKTKHAGSTQPSAWDYLWYALYAFGGLGLELVLLNAVEPLLFGNGAAYTPARTIVHWILTSLCWGIMMLLLVKNAGRKLNFDPLCKARPTVPGMALAGVLVAACIGLNAWDWGTLKIIGEFRKDGWLLFSSSTFITCLKWGWCF